MFLLSSPYLPDHVFSMSDHRDCPFTFQNRPARFQQPQDAEVDGVSDTLSMEIAHSPQIKYIGLAVPAHPLSAFISQDTGYAHLVIKQSRTSFPPLMFIFCTVSCHQLSRSSSCLKQDPHFAVYCWC